MNNKFLGCAMEIMKYVARCRRWQGVKLFEHNGISSTSAQTTPRCCSLLRSTENADVKSHNKYRFPNESLLRAFHRACCLALGSEEDALPRDVFPPAPEFFHSHTFKIISNAREEVEKEEDHKIHQTELNCSRIALFYGFLLREATKPP